MFTALFSFLAVLGGQQATAFRDLTHDEARKAASAEDRILLLDFTAGWCPPCQSMERTTWVEERVVQRLQESTVAIQIDVDEEESLPAKFGVEAIPTILLLKDSEELFRHVGYLDAESLLLVLEDALDGHIDSPPPEPRPAPEDPGESEVRRRYRGAQALLRTGEYEKALEEFSWLWENMLLLSPSMFGVRGSFFASDLADLVACHPPARARFEVHLARAERAARTDSPDLDSWNDWSTLCEVLGVRRRLLVWYDRFHDDEGRASSQEEWLLEDLIEILVDEDRIPDAGRVVSDPLAYATSRIESHEQVQEWIRKSRDESALLHGSSRLRKHLARLSAALHAAERPSESEAVGNALIAAVDDAASRLALVREAASVGRVAGFHRAWLEQAEPEGTAEAELKASLEERLALEAIY